MSTLDYYNSNTENFAASTVAVDFSAIQDQFLSLLPDGAKILDFGCGSGRDTKYFLEKGYDVTAVDGSEALCRWASEYTGITVRQMLFQDLAITEVYEGIWACSSILHLPKEELQSVLCKMRDALKGTGIIYASFKYGDFEGERNGRYFIDMTESSFDELLETAEGLLMEKWWLTGDVREGRDSERWFNVILRKRV